MGAESLRDELRVLQGTCVHRENPERSAFCLWCGVRLDEIVKVETGPGVVRAKRRAPLSLVVRRKANT